MINRQISSYCLDISAKYPVISITGPRQSGKTTLAKSLFQEKPYVNLESPDVRCLALEDPRGFLGKYPDGVILDEIQRAPELPSYIQGIVDEKQKNGMYVLTGSQQFEISQHINQSLAGRVGLVRLLPLTIGENASFSAQPDLDTLMLNGFYPRQLIQSIPPNQFFADYFETYIERDIRQLSQIDNLQLFDKCVKLLASRTGNLLNYSSLANDCGVSQPTITRWISILESCYVAFLLPPFFRNIGKRLIKTPKVYFYDTGLLCFLLGIETTAHLSSHPLRGAIFENLVVIELLKQRFNQGKRSNLSFYRDRTGNEVDIIMEEGSTLKPIEIKTSQTPATDFLRSLRTFTAMFPTEVHSGSIIYAGQEKYSTDIYEYHPWQELSKTHVP
jgi:predicted AAA+ superfamily ATPase